MTVIYACARTMALRCRRSTTQRRYPGRDLTRMDTLRFIQEQRQLPTASESHRTSSRPCDTTYRYDFSKNNVNSNANQEIGDPGALLARTVD